MTLVIAGLGIKFLSHLTKETEKIICDSDKVLYLANDLLFPDWIAQTNKNSESLEPIYFSENNRHNAYLAIKDKILYELTQYKNVCFLIYGNPSFLVQVSNYVFNEAKKNGFPVHILPAISSLDCLLADLNINPGDGGMQLMEATELIVYRKFIDITAHVVIFQPSIIGQSGHSREEKEISRGLSILIQYLSDFYAQDTAIICYEASQYPKIASKIISTPLKQLMNTRISSRTSLYIPPTKKSEPCQLIIQKIKST